MGSSFAEAGMSCAVTRDDQPDAGCLCTVVASPWVRCVRWDGRCTAEAEQRARCICFGLVRSGAVRWRSSVYPIATTFTAELTWTAW